jgi:hypothetical protein
MSFNVQEGEPLVLRLTLPEQDDSKFVQAIVKADNGVALAGSPFTLSNLGDGEYFFKDENNLVFPADRLEVVALYRIYDDSGFTVPTVDYGQQAMDVFRNLEVVATGIGDAVQETLDRLENLVNDAIILRDDIDVMIEDDEPVEVEVQEEEEIEVLIAKED